MWMVEGSCGLAGHVGTGQSLPLRNAGASRNCGRSAVAAGRRRRMRSVAVVMGSGGMVVVEEEDELEGGCVIYASLSVVLAHGK